MWKKNGHEIEVKYSCTLNYMRNSKSQSKGRLLSASHLWMSSVSLWILHSLDSVQHGTRCPTELSLIATLFGFIPGRHRIPRNPLLAVDVGGRVPGVLRQPWWTWSSGSWQLIRGEVAAASAKSYPCGVPTVARRVKDRHCLWGSSGLIPGPV